jgi:hypothetical protein
VSSLSAHQSACGYYLFAPTREHRHTAGESAMASATLEPDKCGHCGDEVHPPTLWVVNGTAYRSLDNIDAEEDRHAATECVRCTSCRLLLPTERINHD